MLYTYPHYYRMFQCIGSKCPDTCCSGWAIMIDDKALKRYRKTEGSFGNRLHNSIDWKEGSFLRYEGRCAFLNEENLCDLYIEQGKDSLCRTCRQYPRHTEEFEGCREISLCLSCPVAAELILGCKEPVRFLEKEDEREETYEDFDFFLYTKLIDARSLIFKLLQDRKTPVSLRLSMVLALGQGFGETGFMKPTPCLPDMNGRIGSGILKKRKFREAGMIFLKSCFPFWGKWSP